MACSVGLAISGMTTPSNVIGFLDVFADWDPTLAFVMGGAIAVHAPVYWLVVRRRGAPRFARVFAIPARPDIDLRLVAGATLFGVGWGLTGFCPGPAVASLGTGSSAAFWFVGAMLAGMAAFQLIERPRERR